MTWNFSQPIADNMEEAVSGVKGELAVKIYGTDLKAARTKGDEIVDAMSKIRGVEGLGLFRVIGQPNLNLVDRSRQGGPLSASTSLTFRTRSRRPSVAKPSLRYCKVRNATTWWSATKRHIAAPSSRSRIYVCWRPRANAYRWANFATSKQRMGRRRFIGKANSRYVAIKYSVRGRDLGSTVEEAIETVEERSSCRPVTIWNGPANMKAQKRSARRLAVIVLRLRLLLIFFILYSMFVQFKWAILILLNLAMAPIGGMLALLLHRNELQCVFRRRLPGAVRRLGANRRDSAWSTSTNCVPADIRTPQAAVTARSQRFRPILMTMLVATLGLLPAATSHGIGSDSQRPFAIVIVGGLMAVLFMSIFLLPSLYVWFARDSDRLPDADRVPSA